METLDTRDPALPGDEPVRAARVLVVEDDEQSLSLIQRVLRRHGHVVVSTRTGGEALRLLYSERPDLVLLDLGLPDVDGRATLVRMRDVTDVPIMIVTCRHDQREAVDALRAGADDYVTKPYGVQEVLARVDALLRRVRPAPAPAKHYADSVLEIDFGSLDVRIAGEPVELTALQLRVLAALVEHHGKVLSPQQLLAMAWGRRPRAARAGEAVRGLPAREVPRAWRGAADRDGARVRLPLPAPGLSGRATPPPAATSASRAPR